MGWIAAQATVIGAAVLVGRPPRQADRWQLGPPDLIVEFPAYRVPSTGADRYRNLVAAVPVSAARWVRAVEIQPGDPHVVHHARLMVDATAASRNAAAADSEPGFDGMVLGTGATNPPGFFVGWTPGKVAAPSVPGSAWPLAPGTDLVLQLHVHALAAANVLRPRVGLYFAAGPPTRPTTLVMLGTKTIDIEPGDPSHEVTDSFALSVPVLALSVYPHAHYLATRMDAWARLPDGRTRWLLRIARWDFNRQDEYRYAAPIALPAGTVLAMRYTYDNSGSNRRVMYGPQSTDEMADLVLQVALPRSEDLATLERDLRWKYYAEQVAWEAYRAYARGRDYAAAGQLDSAILLFRESLSLRNDDPRVHEALRLALAARPR